jgi:hypothetical protein
MKKNKKQHYSHKKNLDNMKLLVSHDKFQEIVKEARNYLNIPENGLSNNKEIREWYQKKLYKRSDKIIQSKKIKEKEKNITKRVKLGKISRKAGTEELNLIYNKVPINYLNSIVNLITDKFKLPLNYEKSVQEYILFNRINAPYNNYKIGPYTDVRKMTNAKYVPVTIYTQLTKKEMEDLTKTIKFFNKNLTKHRPLKDIDKKLDIEKALKKGNRHRVTMEEEYDVTAAEIAEEYLGDAKKGKRVHDIKREVESF